MAIKHTEEVDQSLIDLADKMPYCTVSKNAKGQRVVTWSDGRVEVAGAPQKTTTSPKGALARWVKAKR